MDWSLFAIFVLAMFVASYFGVTINKKEQALKSKLNRGLIPSDIRFSGRPLRLLLIFAFLGGWVGGALGLGGGSIFNPLMISLGVPPSVSTSTGMYMIMFSSAATTIIYLVYGQLDIPFSIWLSFWCSMGIVAGISAINHIIKQYKRQSVLVFLLVGILAFSALLVPVDMTIRIADMENGIFAKELWEFSSICN